MNGPYWVFLWSLWWSGILDKTLVPVTWIRCLNIPFGANEAIATMLCYRLKPFMWSYNSEHPNQRNVNHIMHGAIDKAWEIRPQIRMSQANGRYWWNLLAYRCRSGSEGSEGTLAHPISRGPSMAQRGILAALKRITGGSS